MEINIQSNLNAISQQWGYGSLGDNVVSRQAAMAINRAIDGARTEADRAIRARYNIKRADVLHLLQVTRRASRYDLSATLRAAGHRIPVYAFAPRPSEPGTGREVTVSISKQHGRTGKSSWFVARMKSGHVGVFERTGKARFPIREVYTIAVPEMMRAREVQAIVTAATTARFDKEFRRLMDVALKGSR